MTFLGIDPGLSGALAYLDAEGAVFRLKDMPVIWVRGARTRRREYAVYRLCDTLATALDVGTIRICMEHLHARPPQGLQAAWSLGYGIGLIRGILAAQGLSVELVTPQRWRKVMLDGRPKGKGAARQRAAELWPGVDLGGRADEGRAEALLLAEYARRLG